MAAKNKINDSKAIYKDLWFRKSLTQEQSKELFQAMVTLLKENVIGEDGEYIFLTPNGEWKDSD